MDVSLITFRSVTPAQRGEGILRREGIPVSLQRTPRMLAEQGCGYSIQLQDRHLFRAVEILRQKGIAFGKAYRLHEGIPQEVIL